jgi:hypothetical protein
VSDICDCQLCRDEEERTALKRKKIAVLVFAILIAITILGLCSCAPFQMAGTNSRGPYVVQSGGIGHKMKGGVLKAECNGIKLEQILEEPDGTEIARGVVDMKTTLGLGRLLKEERVSADNNNTKVELGAQDVQKNKDTLDAGVEMQQNSLEAQSE